MEEIHELVEMKAALDSEDQEGWTPLHAAAECGQFEAVKVLLAAKSNIDHRDRVILFLFCLKACASP